MRRDPYVHISMCEKLLLHHENMAMTDSVGVGIDLGTTNSSVAICYSNGRVVVVGNGSGSCVTPSWVAFDDDEVLVGEFAKNAGHIIPGNRVYEIKRILGRSFDDSEIQQNKKRWPFKLVDSSSGPLVEVLEGAERKTFTPSAVNALILKSLKTIASEFLGKPVEKVVITVPAKFNDAQRRATMEAGTLADLEVIAMINEPTAAALSYKDENLLGKTFLVFDFGGGTLDVSLVKCRGQKKDSKTLHYEVIATDGDMNLGGADFDGRLLDHFMQIFHDEHNIDLRTDPDAIEKLRSQCESVKRCCSGGKSGQASVASLAAGINFRKKILNVQFEELCDDLFKKLILPVERVLATVGCSKKAVDFVLLVGGSTRMPKVMSVIKEFFGEILIKQNIHPDEAIAAGAAVYAQALLSGNVPITDIAPFTLGVGVRGGGFRRLIRKGTKLPVTVSGTFQTALEYSSEAAIKIYQGDADIAAENTFLTELNLTNLTVISNAQPFIVVNFSYDVSGLLKVTASEMGTGRTVCTTLFE